ncbi:MAG: class I SAM-dependent methyltransferase [Bryobacteraceae bacterium]
MPRLEELVSQWPAAGGLPMTLAERTRSIYDHLAAVYPLSTMLFHSRAHRRALARSGVRDGMTVLEAATGSGEMFRRLVKVNPTGATIGFDLSPNMAARTGRLAHRRFPAARTLCQAVDARQMPYRNETFDAVFCCYLLELLSGDDIARTLAEFHRVLRPGCRLTLVLIGQNTALFNSAYKLAGWLAPAFWGRQVERRVPELIESAQFRLLENHFVRQIYYPSRVLIAQK